MKLEASVHNFLKQFASKHLQHRNFADGILAVEKQFGRIGRAPAMLVELGPNVETLDPLLNDEQ